MVVIDIAVVAALAIGGISVAVIVWTLDACERRGGRSGKPIPPIIPAWLTLVG